MASKLKADNSAVCSTGCSNKTSKFRITSHFWVGNHQSPVDSPYKGMVMRNSFPCHGVIQYVTFNRYPIYSITLIAHALLLYFWGVNNVRFSTFLGVSSSIGAIGILLWTVKVPVAHAPGMPGTFSPRSRVSDPDMHQGTCVPHVPWCMSGSLTSGFLWSRWRGKRSRHSRRMRNPQFFCIW